MSSNGQCLYEGCAGVDNETDGLVIASTVYVLVWYYHDILEDISAASTGVEVGGTTNSTAMHIVSWQSVGSPASSSTSQHLQLMEAGKMR